MDTRSIGFGGGCHWCTESIFQSLKGVIKVRQGWISSSGIHVEFSEAVVVDFDPHLISAEVLIEIHLRTHSSTNEHSFRNKYRSAIYFDSNAKDENTSFPLSEVLNKLQLQFDKKLITVILPLIEFRSNIEKYLNYYQKHKGNQFCQRYIDPKIDLLQEEYSQFVK